MDKARRNFTIEPEEHAIGEGERVVIGLLRPEDGPGVAQLFKAVYGDGYPIRRFYDPASLTEAHETGESYSLIARKTNGEVIGHVAMFRSSPYPNLYEGGAGLVLPEYRKAGINQMLLAHLYDRVAPELGVEETWGEAVCNHITMQKATQRYKHIETGLEVDLMPAEAYTQEQSARGRVGPCCVSGRTGSGRTPYICLPPMRPSCATCTRHWMIKGLLNSAEYRCPPQQPPGRRLKRLRLPRCHG